MYDFMSIAIEEAFSGIKNNDGGPFGAVIVRNGEIIAKAHNEVIKTNDPTSHAEIVAIRRASNILGRFDLSDCEIYSSCEPCPMCFAAIHWAKITKLYYGCTREDAAKIGFDDQYIYDVINGTEKNKKVQVTQTYRNLCLEPFKEWELKIDRVQY
ncbi:nucleoside deaminase [Tepidibacter aestuarii]|uniref:nucleoside deaminase n=1 Tax=Tepidibacter aestuarii TaxID=2925782 RepID=UPI0020C114AF|nr:nucleoside deaminase [Tepidibacter aestuarii]CAH2213755.1 Guanine deaminase [Tepidibacter aestuarii]